MKIRALGMAAAMGFMAVAASAAGNELFTSLDISGPYGRPLTPDASSPALAAAPPPGPPPPAPATGRGRCGRPRARGAWWQAPAGSPATGSLQVVRANPDLVTLKTASL